MPITTYLVILIILLSTNEIVLALSVETHETFNDKITRVLLLPKLDNYLKSNVNFPNGIIEKINGKEIWSFIQSGGRFEDKPPWTLPYVRSANHFHNPLTEQGFTGVPRGDSAILWAQKAVSQQVPGGYYSWFDARDNFFSALTAIAPTVRNQKFIETFRGIGQLMHLMQDMSVPDHVRNDFHALPAYEEWLKSKRNNIAASILNDAFSNPVYPDSSLLQQQSHFPLAPVPIANLFDTNQYTRSNSAATVSLSYGLSEYTNANFFSSDTIFSSDYPYPRRDGMEEYEEIIDAAKGKKRVYLRKIADGERIEHAAAGGWLYRYLPVSLQSSGYALRLDEKVYADYASKLLPRAVGYSASLMAYFFRGTIELTLPDSGVYSVTDPFDFELKEVRVKAKNTTSTGELMSNGQIKLVVRYRLALEDPFRSEPVDIEPEYRYIVVPEKTGRTSIPKDAPVELVFDLSATPIPLWATNLYLQVVYRGQLGAEADAVAVGLKDISEPTPVDLYNNTDYTCINGTWLSSGSPAAVAAVDTNNDGIADRSDVYPHTISYVYANISPVGSTVPASPTAFDIYEDYPSLPGGLLRIGFVLSDYAFSYGVHEKWLKRDPNDTWDVIDKDHQYPGTAVMNQTGPDDIDYYPYMYNMRGRKMWWGAGVIYDNNEYPSGSSCSWDDM